MAMAMTAAGVSGQKFLQCSDLQQVNIFRN